MTIGTIILAAGSSSRLGQPKQLLVHERKTLVRRITDMALALQKGPVTVVLGANRHAIADELAGLPVTLIDNPRHEEGLSSSLKMGLAGLFVTQPKLDAVLVLLTDQPHVSLGLLSNLVDTFQEGGKGIVACRYGAEGPLGVPALFATRYVDELLGLTGDKGARWVIVKHRADCAEVPFEEGLIDLDSPQDLERFYGAKSLQ
jgi:molybdenum cofactor cytidylyltransferase